MKLCSPSERPSKLSVEDCMRAIDCTGSLQAAIDGWELVELSSDKIRFSVKAESIWSRWCEDPVFSELFRMLIESIESEYQDA